MGSQQQIGIGTVIKVVPVTSVSVTGVSATAFLGTAEVVIPVSEPLPAGTILLFDRGAGATDIPVPSGWTQYVDQGGTALTGFIIRGSTIVLASPGNPSTVTINYSPTTTDSAGSHNGPLFPVGRRPGTSITGGANVADGLHSHPVALATTSPLTPAPTIWPGAGVAYPSLASTASPTTNQVLDYGVQGAQVALIRTASSASSIPQGAVVFSATTVLDGFSRKTWGEAGFPAPEYGLYSVSIERTQYPPHPKRQISLRNSPNPGTATSPNGFPLFVFSALVGGVAGGHVHEFFPVNSVSSPTGPSKTNGRSESGQHSHTLAFTDPFPGGDVNINVWQQFKHLLPITPDSSTQGAVSGMIVMFNGASVPSGWKICDGTNGTPNMVNYFLGYDNTNDSSDVVIGSNTIGQTFSKTVSGTPTSPYTPSPYTVNFLNANNPHQHRVPSTYRAPSTQSVSHGPAFISAPHTHVAPSITANFTAPYLPANIGLIFIQKE